MKLSNFPSVRFMVVLGLLLSCVSLHAQAPLQQQIVSCAAIGNVMQRLACFDELASSLVSVAGAASPPDVTVAPALPPVVAAPAVATAPVIEPANKVVEEPARPLTSAPGAVADFGKRQQEEAVIAISEQGEQTLVDTVASVSKIDSAKIRITLSGGQVWGQTVGKSFLIREGDRVSIKPSRWGNDFRLSVDGKKSYIQVARIR